MPISMCSPRQVVPSSRLPAMSWPKRRQRGHGTQVDDVAGDVVLQGTFDVGADFHVLATAGGAALLDAGHVLSEAHAARAVNAARHVRGQQRADVLVLHHALAFVETRGV